MSRLAGKVAVVTGASKGIGASIAKHLAAEGAAVVVNYSSSKAAAEQVVKEIESAGGKAVAVQANVAEPTEVPKLFAEVKKAYGKVDVLVNNAGIYDFAPIEQVTPGAFSQAIQPECSRPAAHDAGSSQALQRERFHHQHWIGCRTDVIRERGRL